jgi:hypothetical protein
MENYSSFDSFWQDVISSEELPTVTGGIGNVGYVHLDEEDHPVDHEEILE